MSKTTAITPDEATARIVAQHDAAYARAISGSDEALLLRARERLAGRFPGCRRAILSNDKMTNWDRGQLIQEEMARIRAEDAGNA